MGSQKKLDLPPPPTYQTDPAFQKGTQQLLDYGSNLSSGNIPSWLLPTINNNNSANALSYAQGILQPQFRDTLTQIKNEAAANGQLESSTFTDALARSQSDLNSQYQAIVSQQAINDSNQSNQNRLSLFGSGLQSLQGAASLGKSNQDSQNQFNLANYDNLVAQAINNKKDSQGGLLGGLMGSGGGALAGLALAPFTGGSSLLLAGLGGVAGGAAGALTPQSANVGGSLLSSGSGLLGMLGGGGLSAGTSGGSSGFGNGSTLTGAFKDFLKY